MTIAEDLVLLVTEPGDGRFRLASTAAAIVLLVVAAATAAAGST